MPLRLAILLLTLIALDSASAGGRAACRVEFGLSTRLACYAEQTLWSAGPLEVAAGVDVRYPGAVTPYTLVAFYLPDWWITLELGAVVPDAIFRLAIGAGFRW